MNVNLARRAVTGLLIVATLFAVSAAATPAAAGGGTCNATVDWNCSDSGGGVGCGLWVAGCVIGHTVIPEG